MSGLDIHATEKLWRLVAEAIKLNNPAVVELKHLRHAAAAVRKMALPKAWRRTDGALSRLIGLILTPGGRRSKTRVVLNLSSDPIWRQCVIDRAWEVARLIDPAQQTPQAIQARVRQVVEAHVVEVLAPPLPYRADIDG